MTDLPSADRLPDDLPADPMHWADAWIKEAMAAGVQPHANAMTVATVDADGQASTRIVLCKEFVPDPGYLVFHTNYESRKSEELAANPRIAAGFHWDTLGRQIRIEGFAVRSPESESDRYFASRDCGSQLGAWGSDQSRPIDSRDALIAQIRARAEDMGIELAAGTEPVAAPDASSLERPLHWGGIRIWARTIELWLAGDDRIHDRATWSRELVRVNEHEFTVTPWTGTRLQP